MNAGVYVIDPTSMPSSSFTDMPSLLLDAQDAGHRVVVCPIHEYWLDVGRPETLREAHAMWGNTK